MRRHLLVSLLTLWFSLAAAPAQEQTQTAKPSTPEQRATAVEVARSLENDPLAPRAKADRAWIVGWLVEVPDISVKVCGTLLEPLLGANKNYSTELLGQVVISSAAFIIANPDKAKDDLAVYTAGVEGALRAYESILKVKPKARWPFLDGLLEKRGKGELVDYVRQAAAKCKSSK
jgi:carboxypeptidase Q